MPGCAQKGEHRAPKHRGLNEHYWFCLDHVKEYNKAWDFFAGMAPSEVEDHLTSSLYGERPTWRYAGPGSPADALYNASWKSYHFTDEDPPKDNARAKPDAQSPEKQALDIMGLKAPVTLEEIKTRYKSLAKRHHPDLNKGDPASEALLKEINMAYTILKLAYEAYKNLPDQK